MDNMEDDTPMDFEALFRQFQSDGDAVPAPGEYVETLTNEDGGGQLQLVQMTGNETLIDEGDCMKHDSHLQQDLQTARGLLVFPNQNDPESQMVSAQMGELVTNVSEEPAPSSAPINVTVPANSVPTLIIGESGQPQLVIQVNVGSQIPGLNSILLPVVPTLMSDGRIEMRITGNAISASDAQYCSADHIMNTEDACSASQNATLTLSAPSDAAGQSFKMVVVGSDQPAGSVFDFEDKNESNNIQGQESRRFNKKQRTFQCDECDYSNVRRYLLVRHKKSHSNHRPHSCTICPAKFKTVNSLQNHYNTHTGLKPFICQSCPMTFTTSGELVRHNRYKHTFEKPHKCPDCDYATVELSKLKRHFRSHTGERPYKCSKCHYTSSDCHKLQRHLRTHSGEKPYECDVCLARFSQSNSLKAHKLTHEEDRPTYACALCPTTCGRRADLNTHVINMHTASQPITCPKCNMNFTDRYTYKQHAKSHSGIKCFKCRSCDYAAYTQRHLEQHVLVHSADKSYVCPEPGCGAEFRQKPQLSRHLRGHLPELEPHPYKVVYMCEHCEQGTFKYKANLVKHIKAVHTEVNKDAARQSAKQSRKKAMGYFGRKGNKVRSKKEVPKFSGITCLKRRGRPKKLSQSDLRIVIEDEDEEDNLKRIVGEVIESVRKDKRATQVEGLEEEEVLVDDEVFSDIQFQDVPCATPLHQDIEDSFGFEEIALKMKKEKPESDGS